MKKPSFMEKHRPAPAICPVCGSDVPAESLACPECGSDHETGWNEEQSIYDGIDLPDDHFDYDDFIRREFGGGADPRTKRRVLTAASALALVVLFILLILRFR